MRSVRLVLVRHGESLWNVEERYQGQADSGLTPAGIEQAAVAATELRRRFGSAELVVTSDLPRARDTAYAYERNVIVDPRLREVDVGSWTGRTFTEVAAEHPADVAAAADGVDVRRGGGETFAEVRARVWAALAEAAQRAGDGATVVLFTHGGAIRVAAAAALNLPLPGHHELAPPVNTSLTVIAYAAGRSRLVEYNSPTAREARSTRAD
ncbi:MAG: histidine phosphatase family protein [Hamadaea sp.]|nr:histidine phosphatase family protein [Hamadaea sp.]